MTRITPDLLNDTLHLVQLAREAALERGQQTQAERLAPLADQLQELVHTARQPGPQTGQPAAPASGLMGHSDFQILLNVVQNRKTAAAPASSPDERNQVILSMGTAGMADLEIARFMGVTREEVRMILNQGQPSGGQVRRENP